MLRGEVALPFSQCYVIRMGFEEKIKKILYLFFSDDLDSKDTCSF